MICEFHLNKGVLRKKQKMNGWVQGRETQKKAAPLPPPPTTPGWASRRAVLLSGELLVMIQERWRLCGSVALNPNHIEWSCCRGFYPFHRPTQRCCQIHEKKSFVIPRDSKKSEAEDCRTYSSKTLRTSWPRWQLPLPVLLWGPQRSCLLSLLPGSSARHGGACLLDRGPVPLTSHCVTLGECPALCGPSLSVR